ncbi:hypothetical protein NIES4073_54670 [Kalymmatonema gypsitolerans NIES-4073]|nr:hypothetical protein NIES4073_54670 [Scytonema sp. NIES-4073]
MKASVDLLVVKKYYKPLSTTTNHFLKPPEWQLDVIRTVTLLEDFVTKIL